MIVDTIPVYATNGSFRGCQEGLRLRKGHISFLKTYSRGVKVPFGGGRVGEYEILSGLLKVQRAVDVVTSACL